MRASLQAGLDTHHDMDPVTLDQDIAAPEARRHPASRQHLQADL